MKRTSNRTTTRPEPKNNILVVPSWLVAFSVLIVIALAISLSPIPSLLAAPGDLDTSFGTGGKVTTTVTSDAQGINHAIAQHSDGKIIMVGGKDLSTLIRYNVDGSLDTSFGTDGKVDVGFRANAVTIEVGTPNGDVIVVVGTLGNDIAIGRYNSNGTPDAGFGSDANNEGKVFEDFNNKGGGFTSAEGTSVAIDTNSKIVVGGYVQNGSEFEDFLVLRYNTDGTLDTTFDTDGWTSTSVQPDEQDFAYALTMQSDKIILVGATKGSQFAMLRYNSNGTLDTTFGTDGKVFGASPQVGAGYGVAIQDFSSIVVTGSKAVRDESSANCIDSGGRYCEYSDIYLARYTLDGTLDTGFGTNGEVTVNNNSRGNDDHGRAVIIKGLSYKILVVGYSDTSTHTFQGEDETINRVNKFSVVSFTATGVLDTSFSDDGKDLLDFGNSQEEGRTALWQPDGKIVVAGPSGNSTFALARYEGDEVVTPTPETPTPETPTPETPTPETPTPEPTDQTPTPAPGSLYAISTRAKVGTGGDILIAGIIVTGDSPVQVVIRAVGPSLPEGVGSRLADPMLRLFNGPTLVAENDDWGSGTCATITEQARPKNVKESCIVASLEPNKPWTAQVSGINNGTGVGLVEVYLFDTP